VRGSAWCSRISELFPHLTITQNLTLGQIKVLGRKEDEAVTRGPQIADRVGLIAQKRSSPASFRRAAAARRDRPGIVDDPICALSTSRLRHSTREWSTKSSTS
jgi:ABC-type histidine transport system ATPase subunit